MIKNINELNQQIRKIPLAERIERVKEICERLMDDQPVRRSIPAQPTDDDLLLPVTMEDCTELIELLWNFTAPDDPCQFDHNGHCQAHSWFRAKEQCPHARAKEIIGTDAPAEEKGEVSE